MLLRRNSIQNLFNGYGFDAEILRHQLMQEKRKLDLEEEHKRRTLSGTGPVVTTTTGLD